MRPPDASCYPISARLRPFDHLTDVQPTRTHTPDLTRCAACGAPLWGGYYTFDDRPERYCPRCIAGARRCDACAAPLGREHWRLHDGRALCPRCHATAVYDVAEAQRLYEETVAAVTVQLGLRLQAGVVFRLVDAPALEQARREGGAIDAEQKTLGLYQRNGAVRMIYALYGLPRLTFRTVVAHEYAHAWQAERCPSLDDLALCEGFAEWVAYRHLLFLGCTAAARRMRAAMHPYRPLLEQMLALEADGGPAAVIRHMLTASGAPAHP